VREKAITDRAFGKIMQQRYIDAEALSANCAGEVFNG